MYKTFGNFIKDKPKIAILQAENPDGDSLGSALALEEILTNLGHNTSLFCPVDIPKYLRYFDGWSRVENSFDFHADGYMIVDTASEVLLSKLLNDPSIKNALYTKPIFVIDHHETAPDLDFPYEAIVEPLPATGELLYKIFTDNNIEITKTAAANLLSAILSDTLGLAAASVTAETLKTAAALTEQGAKISDIEDARREFMKKSPRILDYKADLIKRIEYHLDGRLATVHIPWDDIREYSDEYNPNVLILEELRLVEGVDVAIAIKTYPDGKLTGKIRSSSPVAEQIAGFFGGGGHPYAAGFRIYENYDTTLPELIQAVNKTLDENSN
jgi:phosphoesterase RecJ-like protein